MAKNLHTILPFFDAISEQNRNIIDWKGNIYDIPIVCLRSDKTLIPFVIRRPHHTGVIDDCTFGVYKSTGVGLVADYTYTASTYCSITTGTYYDYITYDASTPFSDYLDAGSYYIKFTDGVYEWYSEIFNIDILDDEYIKLTFSSDTQLNNILAGFEQFAYFKTSVFFKEFPREDTGDKKDMLLVKEKQVMQRAEVLRILCHTHMMEALMLLGMMDDVNITYVNGDDVDAQEVQVSDPQAIEEKTGRIWLFEAKLIIETVIKKKTYKEMGCPDTTTLPSGSFTISARGDGTEVTIGGTMADTDYQVRAFVTDSAGNTQHAKVTNKTTTTFLVWSPIAGTCEWFIIT